MKSSSASGLADGSFRIGDLVTYTLRTTFQEGTVTNASIQDTLPAGLAYDSLVAWSPVSGSPFTYTAQPVAGSTGTLTWSLGTVVNTGNNDTTDNALTLSYKARVIESGIGNPIAAPAKSITRLQTSCQETSGVVRKINSGFP